MKNRPLLFLIVTTLLFTPLSTQGDTMLLTTGSQAPDFALANSEGDTVRLGDFAGKNYVVLIFYPADQTPGCTKQLCAIRDDYAQFESKNAKVFGVNPGSKESHKKFIEKKKFQFPLLVDENKKVAKLYGCESGIMIKRTVYVVSPEGTIIYAKRGLPGNEEILKAIGDGE